MRAAAVLLAAGLALTACDAAPDPSSQAGCTPEVLRSADPAVMLPPSLPGGVEDPRLYDRQKVGATTLYFAQSEGSDVVSVRDQIAAAYEKAGKTIESKDAEPPAEAEFQFSADAEEGSVQVTPLCQGWVAIRYRIGPK
jgi:hypothetical protein